MQTMGEVKNSRGIRTACAGTEGSLSVGNKEISGLTTFATGVADKKAFGRPLSSAVTHCQTGIKGDREAGNRNGWGKRGTILLSEAQ